MVGAVLSGIVSIAKAVPIVDKYLSQLIDLYIEDKISTIEQSKIDKQTKRTILIRDIQRAKTNEERKAYSQILHSITTSK